MEIENTTVSAVCPNPECGQTVIINQRWAVGEMNDYGGYVLECTKCRTKYHYYLGRDINDSAVVSGAKVLDKYDRHLADKAEVLRRYGLSDE